MRRALILVAALLATPALAAGWYAPVSYIHIGDETATVSWETARDPSLRVTSSAYGAAVGLGYQWSSGLAISAQVLHLREDLDASWIEAPYGASALALDRASSRNGLIVSAQVPLRTLRRIGCWCTP